MVERALGSQVVFGWKVYAFGSLALALMVWVTASGLDVIRWSSIPLVGTLFGALYQMLKDIGAAERARMAVQLEHAFSLGSSSHMANVAFDRFVVFCEDYAKELRATLGSLLRGGTRGKAREHAATLISLRSAHELWLSQAVEDRLTTIESGLLTVGAADWRLEFDTRMSDEERQKVINELDATFLSLMG